MICVKIQTDVKMTKRKFQWWPSEYSTSMSFIDNNSWGGCSTHKNSLFFGNVLHTIFKVSPPGRTHKLLYHKLLPCSLAPSPGHWSSWRWGTLHHPSCYQKEMSRGSGCSAAQKPVNRTGWWKGKFASFQMLAAVGGRGGRMADISPKADSPLLPSRGREHL